jgi:ribonucleoside-triphosphate reductase
MKKAGGTILNAIDVRSEVVFRRTYSRQLPDGGYETWDQTVGRFADHQRWLWERARGKKLGRREEEELAELRALTDSRRALPSGRVLWMGGTPVSRTKECTQFACAGTRLETVYDAVDFLWLLLNGCGVGFKPVVGSLTGFLKPIRSVEVVRSLKKVGEKGRANNVETWDSEARVWTISIGDSSEAWAKSIGKLLAGKYPADRLVIDFSEVRVAGTRLSNYGWISSGDGNISKAYAEIAKILNRRAASLLKKIDILDICNWLGTSLSSRRSAQISVVDYGTNEWEDIATAKRDYWLTGNPQRAQSNNSLVFYKKPSAAELEHLFGIMAQTGGAEPGFINGAEAERRAPWYITGNPCNEILLPNKGFCNLVELDVAKFRGDTYGLHEAIRLMARANYRQTCVSLKDGVLQEAWHLNNEFLRLCGVGLTGTERRLDLIDHDFQQMERIATTAAYSMADELGLPRPKNVTTIKPSGTLSKLMGTSEGLHKPLGRYIFNNIVFARQDPLVPLLQAARYRVADHPTQPGEVIVTMPVCWPDIEFAAVRKGDQVFEVNADSAVQQLERYRQLQNNWTHQNSSTTVSYDPAEVPDIVRWLGENWDNGFVGVSFMYRVDPLATAEECGFPYLPQQCVTREAYEAYALTLLPVDFGAEAEGSNLEVSGAECAGGACPVK